MRMTEEHHAFLIASFYLELESSFGESGVQAFRLATQRYAQERGHRMALRAKAHGFDLDYFAYFTHSEWAPTKAAVKPSQLIDQGDGDFETLVYECPWLETFRAMGANDCALAYCPIIDENLVLGFNPDLDFETTTFLHSHDHCSFQWRKADFSQEDLDSMEGVKDKYADENIRSFSYHTGHVWKTFSQVIGGEWPIQGDQVLNRVEEAFQKKFGDHAFTAIKGYQDTDFGTLALG